MDVYDFARVSYSKKKKRMPQKNFHVDKKDKTGVRSLLLLEVF